MSAAVLDPVDTIDPDRLASFVSALLKQRQEAISGRKGSGIEEDWVEDEEHYQGIDDSNRALNRTWLASIKSGFPVQMPDGATSIAFLNITRPVVDTGAAKVADILLPTDDRSWAIKPTPIAALDPEMLAQLPDLGVDPVALQAEAEAAQVKADTASAGMQREIDDLLTECNWNGEGRQVIEDAARLGSGVIKGPFPRKTKIKKFKLSPLGAALEVAHEIKPASKWVSVWNFFPDPACGENIHNGSHCFERDFITTKTLQGLIGQPGYIDAAIRRALKDGPKTQGTDGSGTPAQGSKGQFEMWTFYGQTAREDLIAAGMDEAELPNEDIPVDAMALLVNDELIKVTFNAMDTGEFPYDVLAWQRRPGMPWGTGIGRHGRTPQRMLNAGIRQMLDNGALSCAPQVVIGEGVTPIDGRFEIRGRKVWRLEPGGATKVDDAFGSFTVKSTQVECMGIVRLAIEMMEQTTGMPAILQGQEPDRKETLGQAQMRVTNASGVLRRLAKRYDDYITKPHIRRYYDWLMQYSPKQEIKGDFEVDVRASTFLVERDSQLQFMLTMMPFSKDPAYGMSPYHLTSEIIKSHRMEPKRIQLSEEESKGALGPSILDQAKTALLEAQTDREKTTAVLNRVEALFSAINTANLVAANPAIAAPADQTALSAGFKDQNAPPIVGPVAPGTIPQPMAENTSPMLPPVPPQADTGVQAGIEGGQP